MCTYQDEGDQCEQPFECETHNCEAKDNTKQCKEKREDDEQCNNGFECKNELCVRYRPTYFVQQIKNLLQKYCQKPNVLPLNGLCRRNVECSNQEVLNDGNMKEIGQMKCMEANLINNKEDKEVGLKLIADFKKNVNASPKENMDQNRMD